MAANKLGIMNEEEETKTFEETLQSRELREEFILAERKRGIVLRRMK